MPDFCQDCTCGRAQTAEANEPVENVVHEKTRPERSFTAPEGWVEPTEGIEPAVPLRSKAWWNNPTDGKEPASSELICRHVWGIC